MASRSMFVPMGSWEGEHQSFNQKIEGVHNFALTTPSKTAASRLQTYNQASKELQSIIAKAIDTGKSLRAIGSSWSLSKVGVSEHELINTKALRIAFSLPARQISSRYSSDHSKLRFLECGASIASINRYLFKDRLSIKTSGSNNGQTLAGAISTGTHGAALRFGACQDFVVGIHLICGPSKHVYLERASYPVVKPGFASKLGAELVRDDILFDSALVSFGSFGIIHGLMIETRDLFLLNAYRRVTQFNQHLRTAISKWDFSGLSLPGPVSKLHHFEVVFNPNEGTPPRDAVVVAMFEKDWTGNYQPPEWDEGGGGLGAGALEIMGELVGSIPSPLNALLKPILNSQVKDQLTPYQHVGAIKDIFRGEKVRGKTLSAAMGMDVGTSLDALSVAFKTYEEFGAVLPILISVRFVKGTKALLGFTKFEKTCVLELDAINTSKTREYLQLLWQNLEKSEIPFTLHWGKFNSFLSKNRVKRMYGSAVEQWKAAREELSENASVRKVFSNKFLENAGLST